MMICNLCKVIIHHYKPIIVCYTLYFNMITHKLFWSTVRWRTEIQTGLVLEKLSVYHWICGAYVLTWKFGNTSDASHISPAEITKIQQQEIWKPSFKTQDFRHTMEIKECQWKMKSFPYDSTEYETFII